MTDPLDDPFHFAALQAYLETYAETRQYQTDSETVRRRAYRHYGDRLAGKSPD